MLVCRSLSTGQAVINMSKKWKILAAFSSDEWPQSVWNILKNKCDVEFFPKTDSDEHKKALLLDKIEGKDGLCCLLTLKIDRQVLDRAGPSLKVVSTCSVGLDHLDLNELKRREIAVGYVPGTQTNSVAEVALTLALMTTRRIREFMAFPSSIPIGTVWNGNHPLENCGSGLAGATVGIVGLGDIGFAVAKRLIPFEIGKIVYTSRHDKPGAAQLGAIRVSLDELIAQCNLIFITCALNESTRNLFGPAQFAAMKSDAILINVARGAIVDQEALVEALQSGRIAGAGLDVTTPEPLPLDHPLMTMKNCVILPHIGGETMQARMSMMEMTVKNALCALEGDVMPARLMLV